MTLNCLIVDDEPLARQLLSDYVNKIPFLRLEKTCASPIEAIEVLHHTHIDILFLDVQMPEITGIGLLKVLSKKPYVILTTAYSEYAIEGYELDVMDYLLKPITFERFFKAMEKASIRLKFVYAPDQTPPSTTDIPDKSESSTAEPQPSFIFVKDGTSLVKIRLADIKYIEGMKDYVAIHTPQKKFVVHQRMKNMETMLPIDRFIRIHHSYIVSLDWIDAVQKERVQIGNISLPISDSYLKAFRAFIGDNM